MRIILEEFVDPRRYGGNEEIVQKIVNDINLLIKYDGYSFIKRGNLFKITDTKGNVITAEALKKSTMNLIKSKLKNVKISYHQMILMVP